MTVSGELKQSWKRTWDASSVEVRIVNSRRTLTPEEVEASEALFEAAERYSNLFYGDGTLIPEKGPDGDIH